jgi:hypothetical protein
MGVYRTRPQPPPVLTGGDRRAPADATLAVDQSSLVTVEQLLRLPTAPEERSFAQSAFRLADQDIDLAFAQSRSARP